MTDRKREHVDIVLDKEVRPRHNYWDDVQFLHNAIPEVDLEEVDLRTNLFGKRLAAPIVISSMTGGFKDAVQRTGKLEDQPELAEAEYLKAADRGQRPHPERPISPVTHSRWRAYGEAAQCCLSRNSTYYNIALID